jgi:TonB family protein
MFSALAAEPSVPPASAEPDVWALVVKAGTVPAYQLYLDRFPQGANHAAAVEAYFRLQGLPVAQAPPPVQQTAALPPFYGTPCYRLLTDAMLKKLDSPEARLFEAARRSNRLQGYRDYARSFPSSPCAEVASDIARTREALRLRYKPIPGLGPLAPHRLRPRFLTAEDYPTGAIRNGESGTVVAEVEVAEDGFVEGCRIAQSSGSASLDSATCRLGTNRLRYDPARNAHGAVIRAVDVLTVRWTLPSG